MRSAKVLLIALCLMAVSAGAIADETAVQEFLVDRDSWISCSEPPWDERWGNGGASATGRAAKHAENYAIFDWDFDVIQQWIDTQTVPQGYYPVFELSIRTTTGSSEVFPQSVWVNTLNCENDWAEGGGAVGFTNFDHEWLDTDTPPDSIADTWVQQGTWLPGEPAVTSEYARTYYTMEDDGTGLLVPTLDTATSVPWVPIYGVFAGTTTNFIGEIREPHHIEPKYINTERYTLLPSDAGSIVSVTLDYTVTQDLLTNPQNFGLFLDCESHDNNMSIYYKENWADWNTDPTAALAGAAPKLTVSFSNAPLDYLWEGATGDWGVVTNWFPKDLPTPRGTAVFKGAAGTATTPDVVTLATDAEVGGVRVSDDRDYEWQGPGVLTLNRTWSHESTYTGAMDCYVTITGPGGIHTKSGRLDLSPTGPNTFTGGVMVGNGSRLHVHSAGALGTGSVELHGVLYTNADGCLSSPTTGGADFAAIVVGANGRLELNSNETARIEVLPTGALAAPDNPYFSSGLNYDWQNGGNVKMHQGAVADGSLMNLPTADLLAPGDGVFGIWLGDTNADTEVGNVGGTIIYRGLATTTPVGAAWPGFDLTDIVWETSGGTLGPMFLSAPGCNFIFNGAFVTADGSNTVKLVGDGDFAFDALTGPSVFNNAPVEKTGSGKVIVMADYALTGTELHVKGGVLTMNMVATAGLAESDVTIYEGAAFQPRVMKPDAKNPSVGGLTDIGTLTIKSGAALDPHAAPLNFTWDYGFQFNALYGRNYTMEKGSQLLLRIFANGVGMLTTPTGELPGAGNANYIVYFSSHRQNDIGENALLLDDDTRITCHAQDGTAVWTPELSAGAAGYVGLVADATEAHINNQSAKGNQGHFDISAKVDLTGSGGAAGTVGKLVIGDTGTFMAFGRRQMAFEEITQDGKVRLSNVNNIIGSVDVVAGELRIMDGAHLGGARTVNLLGENTLFDAFYNPVTVATTIKGVGNVAASNRLTLEPTATVPAGLEPGLGAPDKMTVTGNLAFSSTNGAYPTITLKVLGTGTTAVAGVDYDQVAVTGRIGVLGTSTPDPYTAPTNGITELDLNLSLPVPSARCKPDDTGTIVLVSAGAMGDPTTVETVHAVNLGEVIGQPGMACWKVKAGMSLVDYVDSDSDGVVDQLVLNTPALKWAALLGDANLDGAVGIADLVALAENYGNSVGVGWMDGDVNLDGVVGIADLVALAEHYGETGDPNCGGSSVPEPATLALLAIGGAALIRRRRR